MRLVFKPYRRRDGSIMIYLNNDRGVSIGISQEHGFGALTKMTPGQRKLLDAAKGAFMQHAKPFSGDLAAHTEDKAECGPYTLAVTDVATIGGQSVGSDGAYVVRDGLILRCGEWMEG